MIHQASRLVGATSNFAMNGYLIWWVDQKLIPMYSLQKITILEIRWRPWTRVHILSWASVVKYLHDYLPLCVRKLYLDWLKDMETITKLIFDFRSLFSVWWEAILIYHRPMLQKILVDSTQRGTGLTTALVFTCTSYAAHMDYTTSYFLEILEECQVMKYSQNLWTDLSKYENFC